MKRLLLITVLLFCFGCAQLKPGIRTEFFGDLDIEKNEKVATQAELRKDIPNVTVVSGSMPEGIHLEENGGKIYVEAGYEDRYDVIGTVETDYLKDKYVVYKNYYWTWNFDETWRDCLCWPQAPLRLLTLGMWNIIPTSFPCYKVAPSQETDRKIALINEMKKGTAEMGGNLLIYLGSMDLSVTTVNTSTGATSTGVTKGIASIGYVVNDKSIKQPKKQDVKI